MNVTSVSMNGEAFAVAPNGQLSSMTDSLKSDCGVDFDDYMHRALEEPFPYSSFNPASRTIENLWSARRLCIYNGPSETRQGKVVSWRQWNTGPYCPVTFWQITIEMDSFCPGDTVQVQGLKAAKQHNGKIGTIVKFLEEQGRFKVKLKNEKCVVAIRPQNVEASATLYTVNRMNIEGGGTIRGRASDRLISLEWIDRAEPAIDLDEGVLKALCPTCRSIEPPFAAYNDAETKKEDECPVCLETKSCRTLKCSHGVCPDCWRQWMNSSTTVSVSAPQIAPEELLAKRKENYENLQATFAPSMGGNGSKEYMDEALTDLAHDLSEAASREDADSLRQFWRKARTMASQSFCFTDVATFLGSNLSVPCLEIMIRVLEERSDEIMSTRYELDELMKREKSDGYLVELLCSCYCGYIAEKYEETNNYRCAIPWYHRGLVYAMTCDNCIRQLATMHCNLGLAQKRAGLLSLALENYSASLDIIHRDCTDGNVKALRREMKEWTGSSGKLTPGC